MDLIKIVEVLSTSHLRAYRDDDMFLDRMSHRYSVVLFTLFAMLVTTKAYIGDPIDCWAPPEFKASYERYAETLCFVNGTYFISANQIELPNDDKRYSNHIRYYQWTPFILLLHALVMYFPRVIWLSLNTRYGLNIKNLIDAAKKYESVDSYKNKLKILTYICKNVLRNIEYTDYIKHENSIFRQFNKNNHSENLYLKRKYEIHQVLRRITNELTEATTVVTASATETNLNMKRISIQEIGDFQSTSMVNAKVIIPNLNRPQMQHEEFLLPSTKNNFSFIQNIYDNYLSSLYIFVRLIYLLSAIGQFFFLSHLIGNDFHKIGINLLRSLIYDLEWPHFKVFPRLTFCEIFIREIGTVHPYLIQCVLRINLFNEVIFIVVWFWLLFIIILNGLDFTWRVFYYIISCSSCERKMFALKYLELINVSHKMEIRRRDHIKSFATSIRKKIYKKTEQSGLQKVKEEEINTKDNFNATDNNYAQGLESIKMSQRKLNADELSKIEYEIENNKNFLKEELDLFERFCFNYFNNDTIFALKLIEKNASSLIVSEIIEYLWIQYKKLFFSSTRNTNKRKKKKLK